MGLFGNKEENKKSGVPPMPPAPGNVGAPAPQAPNAETASAPTQAPKVNPVGLSSPPVPGGSLEEIKQEVSAASSGTTPRIEQSQAPADTQSEEMPATPENENNLEADDDLFDFSELEVPRTGNAKDENDISNHEQNNEKDNNVDDGVSFIASTHNKRHSGPYFVTTKQFKSLLEIVEEVKNKVKEASDTHLKLLDIKSEEDIEYDNLRKDFQFIENKLYDVENIIFEK